MQKLFIHSYKGEMPSGYLQYERKVYKKLSNAKKPLKKYGIALYPLLNFVWILFSIKR